MSDSRLSELIHAVEQADSPARLIAAVRALAGAGSPEAVDPLIQVLGYNNPGAAIAAVNGLVQLGSIAVEPLLRQLDDYNYGARAYAIRALAAIADPRALEVLLAAAETDFAPSVRRAAAKGLGSLHWHELPETEIAPAQTRTLKTLLWITQDSEWAIRYAAVVGLQLLASSDRSELTEQILARLEQLATTDPDTAVKTRAYLAHSQLTTHPTQLVNSS
jgi:phycocyanobilin lyase subunit beta